MELKDVIFEQFYELNRKVRTASFYKVDLHIHTPGSKQDYKVNGRKYEKVSKETLEEIARSKGLFENEKFKALYTTKDELMALLIIHEAYTVKELNLIAITDHDNMSWFKNIEEASLKYRYNIAKVPRKFEVLPGVEITCFNGTHIIAIFEDDNYEKIWEFIKYDLNGMGETGHKIFTFKSEMDVVKTIRKSNGIVYIPHLDNNAQKTKIKDMLTPLNGVSKVEILISKFVDAIGFTKYDYKEIVRQTLENKNSVYYRETPVAYLKDSDAHSLEEIGRNYIYIKMDRPCFNSLKFALKDPEHRIKEKIGDKVEIPFIRGMVIKGGFLSKANIEFTYYPFSKSLNCIIGKGGSGKSTVINFITSCLTRKANTSIVKKQLMATEQILLFIRYFSEDYCIVWNSGEIINNINEAEEDLSIGQCIKIHKFIDNEFMVLTEEASKEFLENFPMVYFSQGELGEFVKNFVSSSFFKKLSLKSSFDKLLLIEKLNKELKDKIKIKFYEVNSSTEDLAIWVNIVQKEGKVSKDIYKELKDLSIGQRTAAINTMIMECIKILSNHIPIVIDEPENNLDEKYIFDELIKNIQIIKEQNQIILVTHDVNIPVVGDAENIMAMDINNDKSWVEVYGSLDNNKVKNRVIDELEGGQESFKARMSKYNLI